jgi:hypothetical protein
MQMSEKANSFSDILYKSVKIVAERKKCLTLQLQIGKNSA